MTYLQTGRRTEWEPAELPVDDRHSYPRTCTERERSDYALATAVQRGDGSAEEMLVIRFRQDLLTMLTGLTKDPSRAEDLAHETLIIVLEKLRSSSLEKPHRLSSFVFSTARFSYFGWLRKKDNQIEFTDSLDLVSSSQCSPEIAYLDSQITNCVTSLIERLAVKRDKEILVRHYLRDQTKAEICSGMDLSIAHYDRVISRARKRLREIVASNLEAGFH